MVRQWDCGLSLSCTNVRRKEKPIPRGASESMNAFVVRAIGETIERDSKKKK